MGRWTVKGQHSPVVSFSSIMSVIRNREAQLFRRHKSIIMAFILNKNSFLLLLPLLPSPDRHPSWLDKLALSWKSGTLICHSLRKCWSVLWTHFCNMDTKRTASKAMSCISTSSPETSSFVISEQCCSELKPWTSRQFLPLSSEAPHEFALLEQKK